MTPCEVYGCDRAIKAKGLCGKHHLRMLRHGSPTPAHMAAKDATAPSGHKMCRACGEVKPHSEFKPSKYTHDGRRGKCRSCESARTQELYRLNGKVTSVPWVDRFLDRYEVDVATDCWNWTGGLNPHGYGRLRVDGDWWQTHRLSYALHNGDLPRGALICHHCDNRRCVNPSHLYAGTPQTNADDMWSRQRNRTRRGEQVASHVLKESQIPHVRARWASGESAILIAKEFGVTRSCIYAVVNRTTWKHVS